MKRSKKKGLSFIEVLSNNNEDEMREYLLLNGKKPKPIAPFYFLPKEELSNDKSEE